MRPDALGNEYLCLNRESYVPLHKQNHVHRNHQAVRLLVDDGTQMRKLTTSAAKGALCACWISSVVSSSDAMLKSFRRYLFGHRLVWRKLER